MTSHLGCVPLSSHLCAFCGLKSRLCSSRLWVGDAVSPLPRHRNVSDPPCPACADWFLHGQEFAPGPMSSHCTVRASQRRWLHRPHPQVNLTLEKALQCHPVAVQRQEVWGKAVKNKTLQGAGRSDIRASSCLSSFPGWRPPGQLCLDS